MNEPKPFASLSSGLLARKGAARPAMRPQGLNGHFSGSLDDLGWNDMGGAHPEPQPELDAPYDDRAPSPISALTPMGSGFDDEDGFEPATPVVELQRAAIEASFTAPVEEHSVLAVKVKKHAIDEMEQAEGDEEESDPQPDMEMQADPVAEMQPMAAEEPIDEEPAYDLAPAYEAEPVYQSAPVDIPPEMPSFAANARAKAAFTLRLDSDRHLKLRLACAMSGRSAQQLVTEALDQLLHARPEVAALAGQVPPKSGQ